MMMQIAILTISADTPRACLLLLVFVRIMLFNSPFVGLRKA